MSGLAPSAEFPFSNSTIHLFRTVALRHYTADEARRAAEIYPGHIVVEAITPRGTALVVVPVNDKTRNLKLPILGVFTVGDIAALDGQVSVDTRGLTA